MEHTAFRIVALTLILFGSFGYAMRKPADGSAMPVSLDCARLALGELQKWGTFLIGLQTTAIGAIGLFLKGMPLGTSTASSELVSPCLLTVASIAVMFFAASVLVATWLLSAIPSVHLRLRDEVCAANDVFHLSLFPQSKRPEIGPMTGLQYILFSLGVVMFAVFIYLRALGSQ